MKKSTAIAAVTLLLVQQGVFASYQKITYSGDINYVLADNGTGLFSGTDVGAVITNIFRYGLDDSNAVVTPDSPAITGETDYLFSGPPYGAHLSDGTTSVDTNDAIIVVSNDNPIGMNPPDTTGLTELSSLAGFTINQGDPFDGWSTESSNGNLTFGATIFSFSDLDWTADESYFAIPPDTGDLMAFYVSETNSAGDLVYFALGKVDNLAVSAVPIPAASWLFGFGLLGLIGISKRKNANW